MSAVTLSQNLISQRWNLGSETCTERFSIDNSDPNALQVVLGGSGDADLGKVTSAFVTYLSSPDRKSEDLKTKLVVAHNAAELFGKVHQHNQKIYDDVTITIFHVILAILTLGIFSLRNQYLIDKSKGDLLGGVELHCLTEMDQAELLKGFSLKEFFLLSKEKQTELLGVIGPNVQLPPAAGTQDLKTYLASMKKLPLDVKAATPLSLLIGIKQTTSSGTENQKVETITVHGGELNPATFALLTATDSDFLKTPVKELAGSIDAINIAGTRLGHLSKESAAAEVHATFEEKTLGELSRFEPKDVVALLGSFTKDQVAIAHKLFPRDVFFKALFDKETLGVKEALEHARLAFEGFFEDHLFLHVESLQIEESSEKDSSSTAQTPARSRTNFAREISEGGEKVVVDNQVLRAKLQGEFAELLKEANIASIFNAFAAEIDGPKAFFQCLTAEILDKCDWKSLEPAVISAVFWDYNQERFGKLSPENQLAILNKLGAGYASKQIGDFRVPKLVPDAFWANLPPLHGEKGLEDGTEVLSVNAQRALYSPSSVGVQGEKAEALKAYHMSHWDLITAGGDVEKARAQRNVLVINKAFPKEFQQPDPQPVKKQPSQSGTTTTTTATSSSSSSSSSSSTTNQGGEQRHSIDLETKKRSSSGGDGSSDDGSSSGEGGIKKTLKERFNDGLSEAADGLKGIFNRSNSTVGKGSKDDKDKN